MSWPVSRVRTYTCPCVSSILAIKSAGLAAAIKQADVWQLISCHFSQITWCRSPGSCHSHLGGTNRLSAYLHLNQRVVMMPTLSSQVALEVVSMTTSSATSDDKVGIMTTLSFQCWHTRGLPHYTEIWATVQNGGVNLTNLTILINCSISTVQISIRFSIVEKTLMV